MVTRAIILTTFFLSTLCISLWFVDTTKFDKSYKVINREVKTSNRRSNIKKYYFLICKNELGVFKIDVTENTYNAKPYGSMVRFDKPFSSAEMIRYAINDKTKENILKAIPTDEEKYMLNNQFICSLGVFGSLLFPLLTITLFLKIKEDD